MLDGAGVVLRVWRCAAVIAVCGMACAQGMQTASAEHQFEVASIRQVPEAERPSWMGTKLYPSGRLEISNVDVRELVYESFVSTDGPTRVVGGPKWLDSDKFDIAAKLDDEDAAGWAKLSEKERHEIEREALRRLLEDRFHLKVHTEVRVEPVYAVVQAKGGAKLKEVPAPAPLTPEQMGAQRKGMTGDAPLPGSTWVTGTKWIATAVECPALSDRWVTSAMRWIGLSPMRQG